MGMPSDLINAWLLDGETAEVSRSESSPVDTHSHAEALSPLIEQEADSDGVSSSINRVGQIAQLKTIND